MVIEREITLEMLARETALLESWKKDKPDNLNAVKDYTTNQEQQLSLLRELKVTARRNS